MRDRPSSFVWQERQTTFNFFAEIRAMENRNAQQEELVKLAYTKMPFGKYKDRYLSDLPEHYLLWFRQQGFPKGKLGQSLEIILELKINGMEHILRNIRSKYAK